MSAEFQKVKPIRLTFLAICFAAMASLLLARLVYWQVLRRDDVFRSSPAGETGLATASLRGAIYEARGHYLVVPSLVYDVGASPRLVTDAAKVAGLLAPLLNVPEKDLYVDLSKKDRSWVPLARGLPISSGLAVRDLDLLGITLDVRPGRYHPEERMAAALLGFVNNEQRGFYGLEEHYDSQLRGSGGVTAGGMPQVLFDLPFVQAPQNGADLVLTIDRVIQRSAEEHLERGLQDYQAESGTVIVMDPRTGAILAMAVLPGYDPGDFGSVPSAAAYVNSAVSLQYEPGSVFKVITMAAALDAGVIQPSHVFVCRGQFTMGGRAFVNWDRRAYGRSTMTDILAFSLNTGSVYVADRLGPTRFYEAVRRFGFGERTGIDVAGEIAGSVRAPGTPDWWPSDLATHSFGQGLAVTPIQMVTAVAALANGGVLMRPYVVDRMLEEGQVVWQASPQAVRRVVSAETAIKLSQMLAVAMPRETPLGVVPRYTSAGKTGTAQIFVDGRYDDQAVITSFVGYLPAHDPRFVILVRLDRPRREPWGSRSAAPVWRSVASDLVAYMGIPPDQVRVSGP